MQPNYEGIVQLENADIFVRQYGDGPNLIFVHGGPGWDHTYFIPFVLPLALDFKLTFFDLRDCGRSVSRRIERDRHRAYVDACVEDLLNLIHELEILDPSLLGFSFGGRVAMRFAGCHPEKVHRFILASTTAFADFKEILRSKREYQERMTSDLSAKINQLWSLCGSEGGSVTKKLAFLTLPLNVHSHSLFPCAEGVLEKIQFSDTCMNGYSDKAAALASRSDYNQEIAPLSRRILILHGEKDLVFPVEVADKLHSTIQSSHLVRIPDAGHLAHIEATDAWIAAVRTFLGFPGEQ